MKTQTPAAPVPRVCVCVCVQGGGGGGGQGAEDNALFVKLLLDVRGNVLLNVELFQGLGGAVDGVLLHVLGHVSILNNCFAVGHLEGWVGGKVKVGWACAHAQTR